MSSKKPVAPTIEQVLGKPAKAASGAAAAALETDKKELKEAKNVLMETSTGAIVLELYWNEAPKSCYNFLELCRRGYYDGIIFHRVITDFMIQGGDPTGTGRGGMSVFGEKFEDELTPKLKHTGAGILSMANSGPNTNGSQFFITLAPTPWLDGVHTIFGRVKSGMKVVQRIGLTEVNTQSRPLSEIKIYKARPCE